jgi:hypothetical protein
VSGQLHVPTALPPGKGAPVPIGQEVGWTPETVWTISRRENSWPYRDWNPDQPVASRYTDYVTPAPKGDILFLFSSRVVFVIGLRAIKFAR